MQNVEKMPIFMPMTNGRSPSCISMQSMRDIRGKKVCLHWSNGLVSEMSVGFGMFHV